MKKVFIALILAQIVIITYLLIQIYQKHQQILGAWVLNPIQKETVDLAPSENLKYFYEPLGSKQKINEWIPYSQGVTYNINSDSLNERYEYTLEKPTDTYRIITLGDSFTFGLYVDAKDNWPEKLEDLLNEKKICSNIKKFEVINLGVHGYDQIYSVERFKKRGIKYNPDLVLWMLTDLTRVQEKMQPIINKLWKETHKNGNFDMNNKNGDYYYIWNSAVSKVYEEIGEENIYNYQKWALSQINNYWENKLVVLSPHNSLNNDQLLIVKDFISNRQNTFFYNKLTDLTKINGIFPDFHPNQKGHRVFAEEIFRYLFRENIIPCKK